MDSSSEVHVADREKIDAVDLEIIELLKQRRHISLKIQQKRMESHGPRTVFSREMVILERYRSQLGELGTELALNILRLCRGPASDPTGGKPEGHAVGPSRS